MQKSGEPVRIKLTQDLTRYHPKLMVGEMGWTMPDEAVGDWGEHDTFVAVKFDNGLKWDLLWKGLEIVEVDEKEFVGSRIDILRRMKKND